MFFPAKSQLILMDFRRTLEVLSRSRSLRCSKIFTSTSAYSERCEKWRETVKLKKRVMHFKMSMMSMMSMFCVLWCLMMFYDVSRCLWCFMMCYYVLLCFMFFWKNNRFSMIQHMFSDICSDFMAGKLLKPTTFMSCLMVKTFLVSDHLQGNTVVGLEVEPGNDPRGTNWGTLANLDSNLHPTSVSSGN